MNKEKIKQHLKELYAKWMYSEHSGFAQQHKARYSGVRAFCIECEILTFAELEALEYEVDNE